ncbi:hypothetical protein ACHAWU_002577 [Discostella pseudostelligera]|uniref:UDP-glucose:glycoprotein glucosyltransferase n=1 Tax=Discostella pseudostelligera TaxID=259834 RepID=A0ABD3M1S2_9STRA
MSLRLWPLALVFIYLAHVECWSFFGGDGDEEGSGNVGSTTNPTTKRSLSSFQNFTHRIPIDQPITPRGRRDIEIAVKAHSWPTTIFSPLCEAWSYLESGDSISISDARSSSSKVEIDSSDSLAWRYLDAMVEHGGIPSLDSWVGAGTNNDNAFGQVHWTYQNSTALALEIASLATKSETYTIDENLLPLALALRARSPHCEMHRSLARNAAISFGLYDVRAANNFLPAAFAIISRVSKGGDGDDTLAVLDSRIILDASLLGNAIDALKLEHGGVESKAHDSSLLIPLPDEVSNPRQSREVDDIVAILYGQFGTTAFATLYRSLKVSQVAFVVRHMGHVPYEEETTVMKEGASSRAIPTALQGYGVRLDIRNVEYKAFDDGVNNDSAKDGDAETDWNEAGHHPAHPARKEYLAGISLSSLLGRFHDVNDGPLPPDLQSLQTALIQSHPTQLRSESIVPPAWQRRPLSLQAATVIASSPDPLETLKGVSQNLPSIAHSLSNVQVPDSLEELAEEATVLATKVGAVSPGWGDAAFGLFVNSRLVDVERPSFNVFELLGVLRVEDKRLRELELNIRPIIQDGLSIWRGSEEGKTSAEWSALQSARRLFDMGTEQLKQLGKNGFSDNLAENEQEDNSGAEEKFRVDVGRGGKNAVLYLNDVEKDPQYRSWPVSVRDMLYRSQFGGAPTVRRNLFTMLVVLDPASRADVPALNVVGQLMNNQLPLRLGVLLVDGEDLSKGSASPSEEWNGGERNFHARDSTLLLKHIAKEYGGVAAISCLMHMKDYVTEFGVLSVKEYVGHHVAFLDDMRVLDPGRRNQIQNEIMALLGGGTTDTNNKPDDVNYEAALRFAVDKSIQPGMSFFNGLPFPDGSNLDSFRSGVNDILQYEQRHIMELVMKGEITDTHPKSIYASVLSGDNLFKQFHPLLNESTGRYYSAAMSGTNFHSLVLPTNTVTDYDNVDAVFIVEGVFDLDTPVGIDFAVSFLELMSLPPSTWHDSKRTSLSFRILPSVSPTSLVAQVISNILCDASQFDVDEIKAAVTMLQKIPSSETITDVVNSLDKNEISEQVLRNIVEFANGESKCEVTTPIVGEESNFYLANGRVYVPLGGSPMSVSDLQMLCNFEMDRTLAITRTILPYLLPEGGGTVDKVQALVLHQAIGSLAAMLGEMMSVSSSSSGLNDIAATFDSLRTESKNPLISSWNEESSSTGHLQVRVSVILDPLTEPTQRVAPLLVAIRDVLKLPLMLIIAPRKVVQNDAPFSSYYRFVADPFSSPDLKPPKALFENLPTTHVLTLRLDIPESWDAQQAYAVQDADNLRCDSRSGCEDHANVSLSEGGRGPLDIEKATIEYSLKSLLFFGQCYDVSKGTPPNGLQLTLERSKSSATLESTSAAELKPDGDVTFSSKAVTQNEHTDTLVMKTVGYWQARANPGVWNLRIASESRGAEIYHMVEGKVDRRGGITLSKESASSSETTSKTLVMKDFTNSGRLLLVKRREGYEEASLFRDEVDSTSAQLAGKDDTVHVFSLATGHAYERLLKIMMLSVTKRTSSPVKFWLFENFLSPSFKASAKFMAQRIGCEVEFVTYKWPEWLRGQSEKQRIIWGYKILFLDVLFPLDVRKIIYVDADQVIRGDLTELWNLDLDGAPYGYTPMCSSREETLGYAFWRTGFWLSHLRGKPYHISALYVVDLERFRRELVGDKLRSIYQNLSADPNSLANLDQDLPNYAQHDVRIFSLPQKWLWCESWCSDETKAEAMTIDLCNNPEHKEPKISMAKRIISGDLFEESWEELDAEVDSYNRAYLEALAG